MDKIKRKLLLHRAVLLCVLLLFITSACSSAATPIQTLSARQVAQPAQSTPQIISPTLRSLAQLHHFYIGTTVNVKALRYEAAYSATLAHEFNMVTPEVSMKFSETEPQRDVYTFAKADYIVAFAQAHQM